MRRLRTFVAALFVSLTVAGCGDSGGGLTIELAQNPWTGSAVDVAVARILLGEVLGYPVRVTEIDEYSQWEKIADGSLHACLQVWPSGHRADVEHFIDEDQSVEDGGALGVIGKIGWYVPTYVVEDHPELASWEGLQDPANIALFRTAQTGEHGQFLAGDPTWVQHDQQIIDNLGLDLEVVFAGSEQAILERLDAAVTAREPLLFYFFTPHSAFEQYDLTEVALPPYSDECYARASTGGIDCDYPEDRLFKIFWPGLRTLAPDAWQLLSKMNYTSEDQIEMIALVDTHGMTPDQAARVWLDEHEDVWHDWLAP